jgi:predicted DCC family thiol-disulfide oxidoreductase YuxK
MAASNDGPIVLFDGVCGLCTRTVRFVLARDRDKRFRFAPLQSETGHRLLERCGGTPDRLETLVLVADGQCFDRSDAVLHILRRLPAPWSLLWLMRIVPRSLRDGAYNAVARRRYRLFGRLDSCPVPSAEQRARFLDA